jgi:hypothetical protein
MISSPLAQRIRKAIILNQLHAVRTSSSVTVHAYQSRLMFWTNAEEFFPGIWHGVQGEIRSLLGMGNG